MQEDTQVDASQDMLVAVNTMFALCCGSLHLALHHVGAYEQTALPTSAGSKLALRPCAYAHKHVDVCVHIRTRTRTYIYIYIYICMCVYIYVYMHTHTWTVASQESSLGSAAGPPTFRQNSLRWLADFQERPYWLLHRGLLSVWACI